MATSDHLTVEQLLEQVKTLTENQAQMIKVIGDLKNKANDPFLSFVVPDPIRNIPGFSGNKKEALAWVQDAEQTLSLYDDYRDQQIYGQIIRCVKNKVTGEAKEMLIAAGNPQTWEEIKEAILNAYGDRRDLTSHIQSLFYVRQGKKTLAEYYNKIRAIDTAIKTSVANMDDYRGSTRIINPFISLLTLTRFIDGLAEDISMHVRSRAPESLEHAYEITIQYSNAAYRHKLEKRVNTPAGFPKFDKDRPQHSKTTMGQSGSRPQSGKFRNNKQIEGDASMRTHISKMQVNNNTQKTEESPHEVDSDLEDDRTMPNNAKLDSEDDEYFCEELNFQVVTDQKTKT